MRIWTLLLLCVALSVAAIAAPVTVNDHFSVTTAKITSTGAPVNSLMDLVMADVNRTLFADRVTGTGSDEVSAKTATNPAGHFFIMSADSFTAGIAGALYTPVSTSTWNLTASTLPYALSIDLYSTDFTGGNLVFFVTSGTLADVMAGNTATTSFLSLPVTTTSGSFAASVASLVGGANLGAVTGLGFYHNGILEQDPTYDNFGFHQVPEPGTYALMGLGLAGLACLRRRK